MTIHPVQADTSARAPQSSTAYDSVWAGAEEPSAAIPTQEQAGLERVMLAEDKIYVVLAVVLIIWLGIALYLFRTDRHIRRLEERLDAEDPA